MKNMFLYQESICNCLFLDFIMQYMVVLGVSTALMFSVSVAVLAAPANLQEQFLLNTWRSLDANDKTSIQNALNCCGFSNDTQNNTLLDGKSRHPTCNTTVLNADGVSCQ